jgi:hypothetical protein
MGFKCLSYCVTRNELLVGKIIAFGSKIDNYLNLSVCSSINFREYLALIYINTILNMWRTNIMFSVPSESCIQTICYDPGRSYFPATGNDGYLGFRSSHVPMIQPPSINKSHWCWSGGFSPLRDPWQKYMLYQVNTVSIQLNGATGQPPVAQNKVLQISWWKSFLFFSVIPRNLKLKTFLSCSLWINRWFWFRVTFS